MNSIDISGSSFESDILRINTSREAMTQGGNDSHAVINEKKLSFPA
jgi:hypothetical protein